MSEVWHGHDETLDRAVAVKLLNTREAADPQAISRVRDEARCAARLTHPNAAAVYDFGVVPAGSMIDDARGLDLSADRSADVGGAPVPYIVMELVDGYTLARHLSQAPLDWRIAARVCAEVGAALATAHANNIVHGDIKPGNVMLAPSGAKVLDFGAAGPIGRPGTGTVQGTLPYLAPELLQGTATGPAVDAYALGVLLFVCLTGGLPEPDRYGRPPLPQVDGLDPLLADLCAECLDPRPEQRPTALAVALILAEAVDAHVSLPPLESALLRQPVGRPTSEALRAATQSRAVPRPRPTPPATPTPGSHAPVNNAPGNHASVNNAPGYHAPGNHASASHVSGQPRSGQPRPRAPGAPPVGTGRPPPRLRPAAAPEPSRPNQSGGASDALSAGGSFVVPGQTCGGSAEFAELGGERVELEVCVETARVGQYPDPGGTPALLLRTQYGLPGTECRAVGRDSDDREPARLVLLDFGAQQPPAGHQLGWGEFVGARARPRHQVRDAQLVPEQLALLGRVQLPRREAGSVQGRPESVAGAGEVVPHRSRPEPWIDATEQHPQAGSDDVGQRLRTGRLQPGGVGFGTGRR